MRRLALITLLLAAALATTARAAGPLVGVADDRLLLAGGAPADKAVADWAADGVDVVRIFAVWEDIAGDSPQAPDDFAALDAAVDRVRAAGIEPMLTITGPGPVWATQDPDRGSPRYRPDAGRFGTFAGAVAQHFAGRVNRFVLWNEPNQPFWLQPQSRCIKGSGCVPVAPHLYRDLVNAATPAI